MCEQCNLVNAHINLNKNHHDDVHYEQKDSSKHSFLKLTVAAVLGLSFSRSGITSAVEKKADAYIPMPPQT